MKKLILASLILLSSVSIAAADTIYLRGGTTLRGNVLGFINGRFAIQLTSAGTVPVYQSNNRNQSNFPNNSTSTQTTRTVNAGDVIFLRPRDIERIEIDGRSLEDARYSTRTVDVGLGANWVDTGVDLRRGERLRVDATGTIYAGRSRITPAGLGSTDPAAPLPHGSEGELIGVIGNDYDAPIIEIGASRDFTADRDGRLFLTINRGSYFDARGSFTARIRRELDLNAMARADESRNNDSYDPFGFPDESNGPAAIRARTGDRTTSPGRRGNRTSERTVDVPGNQPRGVDTGIDLRTGDQVTITASGNITAGRRAGIVSPEGGQQNNPGAGAVFGRPYPVPSVGVGALIGYIMSSNGQTSQPFYVGSQSTFTASADGRLYLMVNDDNFSDNSGSFSARIVYPDYR
jgi:hypothetical protein